jgi:Zn-dependent peptidase ImmA (M78 family)
MSKPKKTPEQVLKESGVTSRPVQLEKILEHYGIRQYSLPANADIFGAIVSEREHVIIAINPNQHPHRQRFTVAHELGHFFCHSNEDTPAQFVDGDFRLHWRNAESSRGVNWREIEANRFAAALLMPEKLLQGDVDKLGKIDREAVQHLASLYKVSKVSMQFRLINLGLLPPDVDPSDS